MKKFNIIVEKSSEYWCDNEGSLSVYYHYSWIDEVDFLNNKDFFIREYIQLTNKYKISVPINSFEKEIDTFYPLYEKDNLYYYPSYLFLDIKDNLPQKIVSIDPLLTLENHKLRTFSHGSIPIRIELIKRNSERKVLCYIDNDLFNSWIDNKKTKSDPEIGGKDCWVDNSELAYLNTPRLNSFLRDLKKLCFKYGATKFEFEDLGLNDFTENGILFGDEVVYYEDIVDMIAPKHRIVTL